MTRAAVEEFDAQEAVDDLACCVAMHAAKLLFRCVDITFQTPEAMRGRREGENRRTFTHRIPRTLSIQG